LLCLLLAMAAGYAQWHVNTTACASPFDFALGLDPWPEAKARGGLSWSDEWPVPLTPVLLIACPTSLHLSLLVY